MVHDEALRGKVACSLLVEHIRDILLDHLQEVLLHLVLELLDTLSLDFNAILTFHFWLGLMLCNLACNVKVGHELELK